MKKLSEVLRGLVSRTLSSNLVADPVKLRVLDTSLNAMDSICLFVTVTGKTRGGTLRLRVGCSGKGVEQNEDGEMAVRLLLHFSLRSSPTSVLPNPQGIAPQESVITCHTPSRI
jgi:hypothetical protein